MKKILLITLALIFAFPIITPAVAMADSKKDIEIKVVGKCEFGGDLVQFTSSTPGFPSIRNETTREVYHNPEFISVRQLDKLFWEIIKDGWGLQITELKKGKEWGVDACNGHLLIKAKVCVQSGSGIQLLANAWAKDGGVYELFYDDPDKNPEYMRMFKIGKYCYNTFLTDGTAIVACGSGCSSCSSRHIMIESLDSDDIGSMQMSVYSPGDVSETEAGSSYEVPVLK